MQLAGAREEHGLGLLPIRVREAGVGRTYPRALLFVVEPDAFGAPARVDDVELLPGGDRLVGADRLAGSAIDAVVDNQRGHG